LGFTARVLFNNHAGARLMDGLPLTAADGEEGKRERKKEGGCMHACTEELDQLPIVRAYWRVRG
jgi:hypothetical protein